MYQEEERRPQPSELGVPGVTDVLIEKAGYVAWWVLREPERAQLARVLTGAQQHCLLPQQNKHPSLQVLAYSTLK